MTMPEVLAAAAQIAGDPTFYVEARVGSANYRNRGTNDAPCRAVWRNAHSNEAADVLIRSMAAAIVALSGPMGIEFQPAHPAPVEAADQPTYPLRDHTIGLSNGGHCLRCGEAAHRLRAHPHLTCKPPEGRPC